MPDLQESENETEVQTRAIIKISTEEYTAVNPTEVREYAVSYVQDIVKKGVVIAEINEENGVPRSTEVREYAMSYVKDILAQSVAIAEKRIAVTHDSTSLEDKRKLSGPWYQRLRVCIRNFGRRVFTCTGRRDTEEGN
ncbi:uncharacterized protein LOC111089069 [Limulus polyphemus]|uniref:Uncharacterized protein LOC111089069 n=1 Tax=Limulus polyphemus TaxID=6850 RepID=A0ABM1TKX1_LIMPO|nr:uncharacterized protein LOC111089069 [Limulus polyphemus]